LSSLEFTSSKFEHEHNKKISKEKIKLILVKNFFIIYSSQIVVIISMKNSQGLLFN
jgi:hypothetical protein